jgi:hypothetical protein
MRSAETRALMLALLVAGCAHAAQPADLFDFWVGDWQASWTNADGTPGRGRNVVTKILDGRVIEERFEEAGAGPQALRGRSISVLHAGTWRQAWADNQGGWFAFSAETDGERRIFATPIVDAKGQRMVFHSIRPESFTWDWEGTDDAGKTWKRRWRIDYRR